MFGEISTGASNDLERATNTVRAMVCEYGMSDKIGPLTMGKRHGNPFIGRDLMEDRNYSEESAMSIDTEVRTIINEGYERAKSILLQNRTKMDDIVKVLLEKESLDKDDFVALLNGTYVRTEPLSRSSRYCN